MAANLESDADDDTMLKCLMEMADATPKYLRPFLSPTLELCYKVMFSFVFFSFRLVK